MTDTQEIQTLTLAHLVLTEQDVANLPAVWKGAAKEAGRYSMHRTALVLHGENQDEDKQGRAELMTTDGRKLVRIDVPGSVLLPAKGARIMGSGPTRAVLLDSQALARAMKGRGRAELTVEMRELERAYTVTVKRWTQGGVLSFGIPAENYSGGQGTHDWNGAQFPNVDAVIPAGDSMRDAFTVDREALRSLLDASSKKGDSITFRIGKEKGDRSPLRLEIWKENGDKARGFAIVMPVTRDAVGPC